MSPQRNPEPIPNHGFAIKGTESKKKPEPNKFIPADILLQYRIDQSNSSFLSFPNRCFCFLPFAFCLFLPVLIRG